MLRGEMQGDDRPAPPAIGMAAPQGPRCDEHTPPHGADDVGAAEGRSVFVISLGAGIGSLSMNFWIPFLPLYMLTLGAASDANAVFWVGIALSGQGVARLVSGPMWGALSDRVGRKPMFIRALYFASVTTMIAAVATEPWHVAVACAFQGFFSGFVPAAVALTSVTVPDTKLAGSLGRVTGAQYLGSTVGPAVGGGLAVWFGFRGAIVAAAAMPSLAATMVLFLVPRDEVSPRPDMATETSSTLSEQAGAIKRWMTGELVLALFLFFFLFSVTQLIRLTTPIALADLLGAEESTQVVGLAFTVAGVASVIGVLGIAQRLVRPGQFRRWLILGCLGAAVGHAVLAVSVTAVLYIATFSLINTLIASAAPSGRRGTAFGLASSAQALAFMIGPLGAAAVAAISLPMGYLVIGVCFLGLTALLWLRLKEPTFA
jgi:MFS transporter, DHA1 family, multidrug resistance protein